MIQYELLPDVSVIGTLFGWWLFLSYSKGVTHLSSWMAPGYQQQQWIETGTTILICAFIYPFNEKLSSAVGTGENWNMEIAKFIQNLVA